VVIEHEAGGADGPRRYTIRHARDFDPNRSEYRTFAEGLTRSELPGRLIDLTRRYSSNLDRFEAARVPARHELPAPDAVRRQCEDCLTVYDPDYGDAAAGIPPGVPFDELPGDYRCPVCAAERRRFTPMATA
jgi:rubredoxin